MILDFTNPYIQKIIKSCGAVIIFYLLCWLLVRVINRRITDVKRRHRSRKITYYIASLFALLIITVIWIEDFRSAATVFSIIGAGVAVALREVILDIAGWIFIVTRTPFETGDRIEVDNIRGDVIDISLFRTTLLEIGNWVGGDQSTGRIIGFPNSSVFQKPIFNYTKGFEFIWDEIIITVTFESDWEKAKKIISKHAQRANKEIPEKIKDKIRRMAEQYMIYYEKLTPIVYTNIADSGVELIMRYLTEVKKRRLIRDQICQGILKDFNKEPDIDLAYPTYRIYKHKEEQ